MTIITAADKNLKKIIDINIKQIKKFGYKFLVYNLGELGFGKTFKVNDNDLKKAPIPPCEFKPRLILDAFQKTNDFMVWLDADAILYSRIDEIESNDYDIGVTLRRQNEIGKTAYPQIAGYLNAGVIFINHTKKAEDLLEEWINLTKEVKNDQQALSMLIGEVSDWKEYNVVLKRKGIRIKIFKTDNYNYFYFNEKPNPEKNKILHFKGMYRRYIKKYFKI